MNRTELEKYITENYGAEADFPWLRDPSSEVFRHANNKKWFALIMRVPKTSLGLSDSGETDIVNFKCDSITLGAMLSKTGFFPAYHMNKNNWITAALDGTADDDKIKTLLDMSFNLTAREVKNKV